MREADISPLTVSLRVNGVAHELLADPDTSLMTVLRNDLN